MKEELIAKLEELLKDELTEEVFAKADDLKNDYLRACEQLNHEQLQAFIAEGGKAEEFEPKKDTLDARFNELLLTLSSREPKPEKQAKAKEDGGIVRPKEKEELIAKLEELQKEELVAEVFTKADDLKNEYLRACEQLTHDQLQSFIAEGGNADDFEAKKDPLDSRFNELLLILSDRESKYKQVKREEVGGIIKAKEEIIAQLEKLIAEEVNIGKAFQQFKELQTKWNESGNVPNREYKNLQSIYHRHVHNFYYNMKLSKDLRELDFKRNLEHRTQLLSKIESLLQLESIKGIERMINLYRMEWSELGPTPAETIELLRVKYRELIGQVYQKIREFYQIRQKEESINLQLKQELLSQAQGIAAEQFDTMKQWQSMTERLTQLLEHWKKIGFGPKRENDKIWNEFRTALNTFYANKRNFFGELKKKFKANKDRKVAIIEKTEAIVATPPENWDDATKKILQLQKDWKEAGHLEQWEENRLWKRFREACDKFFEGKRAIVSTRDGEQLNNLKKKEELVERLEAFKPSGNVEEDLKALREFSNEYKSIDHVPFREKQKIWERYKTALDAKYDSLKLEASQMHLLKFRNNVEMLSQSEDSGNILRKEKSAIKEKINKLHATISQYENNLGFFRNSKNMEGLLTEVESNLQRAKDEMLLLQKKLKMFADMPATEVQEEIREQKPNSQGKNSWHKKAGNR